MRWSSAAGPWADLRTRFRDASTHRSWTIDAKDGIIATAGLLLGFAGAGASNRVLLFTAVAATIAGGLSVGGGSWAEQAAERDAQLLSAQRETDDLASDPEGDVALVHGFFRWTRKRMDAGKPPLFSLDVLRSSKERSIVACMALMLFIGTATSFLLPLYMQVVQGYSGWRTSLTIVPYTLSIFVANTLVVRLYDRYSPARIARIAFIFVFLALTLIAFTINNDWGTVSIIVGLVTLGLAQGCIVALVFNKLLLSAPKEQAGDVGAFRGLTHNISGSAGIAVATAIAVSMLGLFVARDVAESAVFRDELVQEVNLDRADFITNDQLKVVLEETSATPAEVEAAIEVLSDARLDALRLTLMLLAALALLALVPAGGMPDFRKPDLTVDDEEAIASGTGKA